MSAAVAVAVAIWQECGISKAGELSALSEAAGSFVHVDLKANLLSEWQEVMNGRLVVFFF